MTSRRKVVLLIALLVCFAATAISAIEKNGNEQIRAQGGPLTSGSAAPQPGRLVARAYCEGFCNDGSGFYCYGATAYCVDGVGCQSTGSGGGTFTYYCN
jgi:hypothetical protein